MKKICFLLFLFSACIVQAQNSYCTDKDISYVSGSETDTYRLERQVMSMLYNVVNLIFIIPKIRGIFRLSYGSTVGVWKVEVNLFPKN